MIGHFVLRCNILSEGMRNTTHGGRNQMVTNCWIFEGFELVLAVVHRIASSVFPTHFTQTYPRCETSRLTHSLASSGVAKGGGGPTAQCECLRTLYILFDILGHV